MRKFTQEATKLLLQHTPAYTRQTVQSNIKIANLESIEDKKVEPIIHYINALQKHKEYLDFFEIGIVRDQKKKIENVAKYVGLAIRDYTQAHENHETSLKQKADKKQQKQDLSSHGQIIQNWVKNENTQQKQNNKAEANKK